MKAHDLMHIYATIGDLKEIDYRNTLAIATIIKVLVDKGIISEEEFRLKATLLDHPVAPTVATEDRSVVSSPDQRLPGPS